MMAKERNGRAGGWARWFVEPRRAARRRMYAGGSPGRLARFLNARDRVVAARGLVLPERMVALEVPGRSSGRTIRLPVVVADLDGHRYLVSMLGERAGWVHNVRASGGHAVLRHGRTEHVVLAEIDAADRPAVLRRYLECAPGARAHVPVDRSAPLAKFAAIAARYPIFRIDPRDRG